MIDPPLTRRQHAIYEFLKTRILGGLPPTVREIGEEFSIRSPNGVMCHLRALEKKGLINRDHHLSRAISLTHNPYDMLKMKCKELIAASAAGGDIRPIIKEIGQLI